MKNLTHVHLFGQDKIEFTQTTLKDCELRIAHELLHWI